jgi:hypothetical protein
VRWGKKSKNQPARRLKRERHLRGAAGAKRGEGEGERSWLVWVRPGKCVRARVRMGRETNLPAFRFEPKDRRSSAQPTAKKLKHLVRKPEARTAPSLHHLFPHIGASSVRRWRLIAAHWQRLFSPFVL